MAAPTPQGQQQKEAVGIVEPEEEYEYVFNPNTGDIEAMGVKIHDIEDAKEVSECMS